MRSGKVAIVGCLRRQVCFFTVVVTIWSVTSVWQEPVLAQKKEAEKPFDLRADEIRSLVSMGSCKFPSFSPDGKTVAFASNLSGTEQIWTVPLGGGWPAQLTAVEGMVGVTWSPKIDWLCFLAGTGERRLWAVRASGTGMKRLSDGDTQISIWSRDGRSLIYSSTVENGRFVPYKVEVESGNARRILRNVDSRFFVNDVTRDGKRFLATLWKSSDESELYVLSDGGDLQIKLSPERKAMYYGGGMNRCQPRFAYDEHCVYTVMNDGNSSAFVDISLNDKQSKRLIEVVERKDGAKCVGFCLSPEGNVAATVWSKDDGYVFDLVNLETKNVQTLPVPKFRSAYELEFSPDGRHLAFSMGGSAIPDDIYIYNVGAQSLFKLTSSPHPGVDLSRLVAPNLVSYTGAGSEKITALLYQPKTHHASKPFVVLCNGTDYAFDPEIQALLSQGIGVIAPEIREAPDRMHRKDFDSAEAKKIEVGDIKAAVDYLVSNGLSTAGHIGIAGFSHGGRLAALGMTELPNCFAAGMVRAGIVDYVSYLADSSPLRRKLFSLDAKDEAARLQIYRDLSPMTNIDKVKAPIMVQTCANDAQIPSSQGDLLVRKLRERGTPIEVVYFEDEGHWIHKLPNRIRSISEEVRFFSKYLL